LKAVGIVLLAARDTGVEFHAFQRRERRERFALPVSLFLQVASGAASDQLGSSITRSPFTCRLDPPESYVNLRQTARQATASPPRCAIRGRFGDKGPRLGVLALWPDRGPVAR
jgi:hypothetical protein